ncbi:MAG: 4-hydroxy-tetrahydrodipicolinate reductase [Deltaproteobacteria bacterium]|nr:4-hydroxy-tetrahydrodipicolinate reductase [Deltaproteobacteria bacterium]NIS76400.1 4-hydroxy-tetrahydrodipicolinate reductase [Deltaproteobacteria bacterium]
MIKVLVAGAAGKMGRVLSRVILNECDDMQIVGALEADSSGYLGQDAGSLAGTIPAHVSVTSDFPEAARGASVMVDFTEAGASVANVRAAAESGLAVVVGTTGFTAGQKSEIEGYGKKIPLVLAPNMSVGVNLLFKVVRDVAKVLGRDYDVEMFEVHHRFKKDAPSGTAVRLGEIVADELGLTLDRDGVFGRRGIIGERKKDEIGVMTLRAGDVVGEHTVIFGGIGERVEITHRAHTRETFVRGAIRAIRWVMGREAGLYDMQDVLGIK